MVLREFLIFSLLLVTILNSVFADFTLTRVNDESSKRSLLNKIGNVRVKRAWDYPPTSIQEHIAGETFTKSRILEISSDSKNVQRYELLPGSPGVDEGYFSMRNDAGVGAITQLKPVDRETFSQFIITARALDASGQKAEPNDVDITIRVLDDNDNAPVFDKESLIGEVSESAVAGTTIWTIRASDADSDYRDYGKVRFYYDGNQQPPSSTQYFGINEQGDVSLLSSIDRETVESVSFRVLAKDGLTSGFRHSTNATVTVRVLDSNDNRPQFTRNSYEATVGELADVGTVVATVVAEDADIKENKKIHFEIEDGNFKGHFDIISKPSDTGPSTGDIVIAKKLNFEEFSKHNIYIKAYNKDANENVDSLKASAEVSITVTDENEPPVFLNTPYIGKIPVPENSDVVIPDVVTVTARDYDFGSSQTVTLGIESTEGWFDISQDGVVSAVKPVDREYFLVVNQTTNIYELRIRASDGDPSSPDAFATAYITIGDKNDNAPTKGAGWDAIVCEKPSEAMRKNVTELHVDDSDSDKFAPFQITLLESEDSKNFHLETTSSSKSALLQIPGDVNFDAASQSKYELPIQLSDKSAEGQPSLTSTETLTVKVCRCSQNYEFECNGPAAVAGFPVGILIALIAAILIILIIVLALVAYKRRQQSEVDKQALFYDEDDVRENLQAYHEEGGEEDNDGYDIGVLNAPPLAAPKRQDMTPLGGAVPQPRTRIPPDTDIGDYINDAKQQADSDPTAPPFDSILVFDYEGQGSDAGSLSSLNSGTTDASQDYDYLNDWGPRFKKLADMYGGGEED